MSFVMRIRGMDSGRASPRGACKTDVFQAIQNAVRSGCRRLNMLPGPLFSQRNFLFRVSCGKAFLQIFHFLFTGGSKMNIRKQDSRFCVVLFPFPCNDKLNIGGNRRITPCL